MKNLVDYKNRLEWLIKTKNSVFILTMNFLLIIIVMLKILKKVKEKLPIIK